MKRQVGVVQLALWICAWMSDTVDIVLYPGALVSVCRALLRMRVEICLANVHIELPSQAIIAPAFRTIRSYEKVRR